MSAIVIGVDGGGTQTRVQVADEDGKVLGSVTAPGSAVRPPSSSLFSVVVSDAHASLTGVCEIKRGK